MNIQQKVMEININDLPSELLVYIFSYIPQRELFRSIDKVCQLWKDISGSPPLWTNIEYTSTYTECANAFGHLLKIQNSVKTLTITPGHIIDFFGFERKIHFKNLKALDISDNLVVSEVFFDKIIKRCPSLENIKFISDSRFNMEHCLETLCGLKVVSLDIGYYGNKTLDDHLLSLLRHQPQIRSIAIRGWYKLKDETIATIIDELRCLRTFYLSDGELSNTAFPDSNDPLNLSELTIHLNLINDEGLLRILKRCKFLKMLNIEQSWSITDQGLVAVANYCQLLEELHIGNSFPQNSGSLTNRGLLAIAEKCHHLKYFSTISCNDINDVGVMSVLTSCRRLTCITMDGCTRMTDKSLISLADYCPFLKEVDFRNCSQITALGVYYLVYCCTNLQKIILAFCTCIEHLDTHIDQSTDSEENKIKELIAQKKTKPYNDVSHSHLKEINLRCCINISKETVLKLINLCPDLRRLNLSNCIINFYEGNFLFEVFKVCRFLSKFKVYNRMVRRSDYRDIL